MKLTDVVRSGDPAADGRRIGSDSRFGEMGLSATVLDAQDRGVAGVVSPRCRARVLCLRMLTSRRTGRTRGGMDAEFEPTKAMATVILGQCETGAGSHRCRRLYRRPACDGHRRAENHELQLVRKIL